MRPQCAHITVKRGVYYYRRRWPHPHLGEIAVSLKTRHYREAEHRARVLDAAFQEAWGNVTAEKAPKVTVDVLAVVRGYLGRVLDHDLQVRRKTPSQSIFGLTPEPGETVDSLDLAFVDAELQQARSELAQRAYEAQRPLIDELMAEHNVPPSQRADLAFSLLRARVEAYETIRKRTLGEYQSLASEDVASLSAVHEPAAPQATSPVAPAGPLLSTYLPKFVEWGVAQKGWQGQTKAQNETTYRLFVEWCGDKTPQAYTKDDLAGFYDMLLALPALYSKDARWRDLSLADMLANSAGVEVTRLSMKTTKRHFSALGSLFTWLKSTRRVYVGENPAYGFQFPTKATSATRLLWEGVKLTKLFASPVWIGCHPYYRSRPGKDIIRDDHFWLPLLGLFHGNRLEEFAQLRREDVQEAEGIPFFDIHDGGERQLKNDQSIRRVPVHPVVLSLGFIDYVSTTAPKPEDMVFPALRPGGPDSKVGGPFTQWWTNYRRTIGVYARWLDYHSFRHGVTTKLFEAGVPEVVVDELTGHEGQGTSRKVYNRRNRQPLATLRDAIAKVQWPEVSLDHLVQR